jgi:hypothetical protein
MSKESRRDGLNPTLSGRKGKQQDPEGAKKRSAFYLNI